MISDLYARLEMMTASPVVRLNRAVAVAEVDGPAAGLTLLDGLGADLDRHHMFYAIRADLLRRLGRRHDAAGDYRRALERCTNEVERAFLSARLAGELGS